MIRWETVFRKDEYYQDGKWIIYPNWRGRILKRLVGTVFILVPLVFVGYFFLIWCRLVEENRQ